MIWTRTAVAVAQRCRMRALLKRRLNCLSLSRSFHRLPWRPQDILHFPGLPLARTFSFTQRLSSHASPSPRKIPSAVTNQRSQPTELRDVFRLPPSPSRPVVASDPLSAASSFSRMLLCQRGLSGAWTVPSGVHGDNQLRSRRCGSHPGVVMQLSDPCPDEGWEPGA